VVDNNVKGGVKRENDTGRRSFNSVMPVSKEKITSMAQEE
jgi:hypothetical protein